MVCLLLLAVWLVLVMLPGVSGFARVAVLVLLGMKGTLFLSVLPLHLYGGSMLACSLVTPIPCGPLSPSVIIGGISLRHSLLRLYEHLT